MDANKQNLAGYSRRAGNLPGGGRLRAGRSRRDRGRMLLEVLEDRRLMTVQPTAVTLTPNPVEAVPFSGVIVATFISPGDPNANDFTAGSSINWGDSSVDAFPNGGLGIISLGTTSAGPQFAVVGSHTYAETVLGQSLPVTVNIHDNVNGTDTQVVSTANILDAPLTHTTPTPFAGTEGAAITSIPLATFSRASTDHSAADYVASVDWGDGTPLDPTATIAVTPGGAGTPDTIALSGSHTYAHKGTYNVTVKLTDHGSQASTVANTATIHGATLSSDFLGTLNAIAGSPLTNATVAGFTSPNLLASAGDFAATVDWGGTTEGGTVIQTGPGIFAVLSSFTFPAAATAVPVTTSILETAGATPAGDQPTTVVNTGDVTANVVPSPLVLSTAPIFATAGVPLPSGGTPALGTLVGTFYNTSGIGTLADYTASVDFGNGQTAAATIVASGQVFSVYVAPSPAIVYGQAGQYPVKLTVTDTAQAISASSTTSATVTAAALVPVTPQPVVAATQQTSTGPIAVAEFTDANTLLPLSDFSATIDWGDGTPATAGQILQPGGVGTPYVVTGSHIYANPTTPPAGPDAITVTILGTGSRLVTTTTANVAASTITGTPAPVSAVESVPLHDVTVATFTDSALPGPIGAYSATINWGTGSPTVGTIVPLGGSQFAVLGSFTYSGEFAPPSPAFAITTTISHNGVAAATVTSPVTLTGAALTGSAVPIFATVGTPFSGTVASFTDANPAGTAADFTATIHWGDGGTTSGTVVAGGSGFLVTGVDPVSGLAYVYAKAGSYADSVTVTGVSGTSFTAFATATVAPAKLTLTGATLTDPIFPPFTATTAAPLATIVDADPADVPSSYTVTINWGDGITTPGSVAVNSAGMFVVLGSHQYSAIGTYAVSIGLASSSGSSAQAVSTLTITDTPLVAGPPATISATEGKAFSATVATFTNINPFSVASDYSATVDWGDGTSSSGTVTKLADGSFAVTGSHTYASPTLGSSPDVVTVSIQDKGVGGSSATVTDSAIVYDAAASASAVNFTIPVDQQYSGPVATFTQSNLAPLGLLAGTSYTVTINWGDGTAPTSGSVVPIPGGFEVIGTHTYLNSRTSFNTDVFPVTVSISDNVGNLSVVTSLATVTDAAFYALLDPTTDTGISPLDGVTTDEEPRFFGKAEAGATIELYATPIGTSATRLVGVTTADAGGSWSTATTLLTNGYYAIQAIEVDGSGFALSLYQALPNPIQGALTVDTFAPRVASVTFGVPTGQLFVTFQAGVSGLDLQSLSNASNYVLQKGGKSYGSLLVTAIHSDPQTGLVNVAITINGGKPLGGGTYTLTIHSGGVRSLAGAPLDGLYFGSFPSGVGIPGGNFVAQIDFLHHTISKAKTFIGTAKPIQASPISGKAVVSAKTVVKASPTARVQAQSVLIPMDVQDAALADVATSGTTRKKKSNS